MVLMKQKELPYDGATIIHDLYIILLNPLDISENKHLMFIQMQIHEDSIINIAQILD